MIIRLKQLVYIAFSAWFGGGCSKTQDVWTGPLPARCYSCSKPWSKQVIPHETAYRWKSKAGPWIQVSGDFKTVKVLEDDLPISIAHSTTNSIASKTCHALCEMCWAKLTKSQRLPFYERMFQENWRYLRPEARTNDIWRTDWEQLVDSLSIGN